MGCRTCPGRREVGVALERFVALVSQARGRKSSGEERPLFSVEVQVWIREVRRLKRTVSLAPAFRWADSPSNIDHDNMTRDLPSVYCTSCGRSGWLGVVNRAGGQGAAAIERIVYDVETDPYAVSLRDRGRTRTMLRANPAKPTCCGSIPTPARSTAPIVRKRTAFPSWLVG